MIFFDTSEEIIEMVRSLKVDEAKAWLDEFIEVELSKMKLDENFSKFYKKPFRTRDKRIIEEAVEKIQTNSNYGGFIKMCAEKFEESTARLHENLNTHLKPSIKFPRFEKSSDLLS